jgi:drug/metabolite transporter (DMT)-like permease
MLVAGLLFGCMGVCVKLGAAYFSNVELVFYRSFFGLFMVYALIYQQRGSLLTPHWGSHLWRSLSGSVAILLFFYCITVLPLATAVTLNYTSSLFLVIFTLLVFKDRFHAPLSFAIALGFVGVILLLHPTLEREQLVSGVLGLISGFFAGIAMLNVKQLGIKGEPEWRVVFYFSLIAALISGGFMLCDHIHPITPRSLLILLGLAGSGTLAQLAMTRAYAQGKTLVVGSLAYSTVVFAALFGWWLWNEALSASSLGGIGLIVASGVLSLRLSPKH